MDLSQDPKLNQIHLNFADPKPMHEISTADINTIVPSDLKTHKK